MTRQGLIARLEELSEAQYTAVALFLEADLESIDDLAALRDEVARGRASAVSEPLLTSDEVFSQVRRDLTD